MLLESQHLKLKSFNYKNKAGLKCRYHGYANKKNKLHTGYGIRITDKSIEEGEWYKGALYGRARIIDKHWNIKTGLFENNQPRYIESFDDDNKNYHIKSYIKCGEEMKLHGLCTKYTQKGDKFEYYY